MPSLWWLIRTAYWWYWAMQRFNITALRRVVKHDHRLIKRCSGDGMTWSAPVPIWVISFEPSNVWRYRYSNLVLPKFPWSRSHFINFIIKLLLNFWNAKSSNMLTQLLLLFSLIMPRNSALPSWNYSLRYSIFLGQLMALMDLLVARVVLVTIRVVCSHCDLPNNYWTLTKTMYLKPCLWLSSYQCCLIWLSHSLRFEGAVLHLMMQFGLPLLLNFVLSRHIPNLLSLVNR